MNKAKSNKNKISSMIGYARIYFTNNSLSAVPTDKGVELRVLKSAQYAFKLLELLQSIKFKIFDNTNDSVLLHFEKHNYEGCRVL